MNQTTLNAHYKKVADVYEKAYTAGQNSLHSLGAKTIIQLMEIGREDRVVDLGAGTCDTAGYIATMAGLEKPLICVDPVREMLDIGIRNKIANIQTICETAEQFSEREIQYDKIYLKMVIHHLPLDRLRKIFTGITRQLSKSGTILIDKTKEQGKSYPTFLKARQLHMLSEKGRSELLQDIFQTLGYKVTTKIVETKATMTKSEAIRNIKNRYTSTLELLSDEEIQAGIEEVERNFPDVIEYDHKREIIIATKC